MLDRIKHLFEKQESVPQENWQQRLRHWGKKLVPLSGEADTLQGELVRCIDNLSDEAQRNGWMNWDEGDEEAIETIRRFLPEPEVFSEAERRKIQQALDSVYSAGKHGADKGKMAYAELDYLAERIIEWCDRSEALFTKVPKGFGLMKIHLRNLQTPRVRPNERVPTQLFPANVTRNAQPVEK